MEKEFIKVRSLTDIAISISLAAAGIIIVALPTSISLNIVGYVLLFTGIFLFFTLKSAYLDKETRKIFRKKEKYYSHKDKEAILKALNSKEDAANFPQEEKASSVRLDIYYNGKDGSAYARMYEYIPYQYVPASPFFECSTRKIGNLLK